MPTSINGWPVIGPDKHYLLATGHVPGTHRKLTTRREVLPFFLALAHDYDKHVTSIDRGKWDDGGYNYRKSRLNSNWSNHSSGTAIDLDWAHEGSQNEKNREFFDADHPKHHTGIKFMKDKYGDLVNWGGDWHGHNYDPMHWELKKGTSVHDVKEFLRKHDIDKNVPGYNAIIKAQDEGIANIQAWRLACRLKDLGYFHGDPVKYEQTYPRKAMENWQEAHGYDVHPDGEYGPKAHKLLFG